MDREAERNFAIISANQDQQIMEAMSWLARNGETAARRLLDRIHKQRPSDPDLYGQILHNFAEIGFNHVMALMYERTKGEADPG